MLNLVLDAMSLMDDALFMAFSNSIAKLRNNAELEKHFWRNHAVCPINKGNSEKNEESLKVDAKQIYAVR